MPDDVTWFPVCAGLSAFGVVMAFLVFRRRGLTSGLRILGWSALPMAAYLTGVVTLLWRIGVDVLDFAAGFAFSMRVWLGVAVFGVAVVLFVVSGLLRGRRRAGRAATADEGAAAPAAAAPGSGSGSAGRSATGSGRSGKGKKQAEVGQGSQTDESIEGLEDIEEILRRRGIQ